MASRNQSNESKISTLAVDLDGTFLPLDEGSDQYTAMRRLGEWFSTNDRRLIYVTGRHYASVREAMTSYGTPVPDRLICDVGTSIYRSREDGDYEEMMAYREHLNELTRAMPLAELAEHIQALPGLRKQEAEKQGPHKLSFYTEAEAVEDRVRAIEAVIDDHGAPFSVVGSVDPFNNDGLIDVLPRGVNKAYGLKWLAECDAFSREEMIFAGDSGNDLAALTAGSRAVLVGNASESVKNAVRQRMEELKRSSLLYVAKGRATSGVLEGCEHFGAHFAD